MRFHLALLLLSLALVSCAGSRGFDRGAIDSTLRSSTPVITDEEIRKAYDLKPQLPNAYKLAVYFKEPPTTPEMSWARRDPLWLGANKDSILALGDELKAKGVISDMFVISNSEADSDLKSIRLAAARYGADAVITINGASAVDSYSNVWAATYFLLVPMAIVPGSELDALFAANATMWDVRNQYLYLSAEAEGTAHQTGALTQINETFVMNEAQNRAMGSLRTELRTRLLRTAGIAP